MRVGESVVGTSSMVLRAATRFLRLRHGWSWAVPVLVMAGLMTAVFVVATQAERTPANARQHRLAGYDVAVYLNDLASTLDDGSSLDAELKGLAQQGFTADCYTVGAGLTLPRRANYIVGFQENSAACPPSEWGNELVEGRWPVRAGEVVSTTGSGFGLGETGGGLTPEPFTVVGIVESRHDLKAQVLFAAPGTWESWGWPEAATRFPLLTATATVFLNTEEIAGLNDYFAQRAVTEPLAANVEILDVPSLVAPGTLLERFHFLYRVTGPVAVLLAVLVAFAFRRRLLAARVRQLIDLGMPIPGSVSAVALAFACGVAAMMTLGVTLGWVLGAAFGGPAAEWVSGHEAAAMPEPWDPVARLGLACLVGILVATLALVRSAASEDALVESPITAPRGSGARHLRDLAGITLACLSVWSVFTIGDFAGIYLAILLTTLAVGCWSSTFALIASRALPESRPTSRLAKRRMNRRMGASALMFAVGALTTGPVAATMILVATQVESENESARMPPATGQALYFASGLAATDDGVITTALKVAGPQGAALNVYLPTTDDGRGIVASPQGLGAVGLIEDVQQVGEVLRAEVPADVVTVLEAGGIAFLVPGGQPATVWTVGNGPTREIPLTGATYLQADDRWTRQLSAVMLTETGKQLGWSLGDPQMVITHVDDGEAAKMADAMAKAGFAPSIVRTFTPEDPYSISPLMYGLLAAIGAVGVALLVGASRASLHSLRAQSEGLFSLGAPRIWQGRVFAMETAGAYVPGVLIGTTIAVSITALGVVVLGFTPIVPLAAFSIYLVAAIGAVATTVTIGTLRLRATDIG